MTKKSLTLSIVIPVYNEQDYLKACLDSIAAQAVMPDEIIIVDNNSTDRSLQIAARYPFVRIIKEPRQHQSYAQKTGFDAATTDIIGRIDADSILPADWVENVIEHFSKNSDLVAITGGTLPYDMAARNASSRVFAGYNILSSLIAGSRMLWGANCALRRDSWQKVSQKVTTRSNIWEDYDLSFCLAPYGNVTKVHDIDVGSSFRAVHKPLSAQTEYQIRCLRTFRLHTGYLRTLALALVWSSMYLIYFFVLLDRFVLSPAHKLLTGSPRSRPVVSLDAE
ncbi:glycosyltransferase [Candidatus Saccharibacteria bacterium]|nr:glycosyltransferase [Candidatus Saccharibacteria bacterium]